MADEQEVEELEEQVVDARSEARKASKRALEIRRAADERLTIISRLIRALEVAHPVSDDSIRTLLREARECIAKDPG